MESNSKIAGNDQRASANAGKWSANERKPASRAQPIGFWVVTALISFELVHGALWDFNVLNQGYTDGIFKHLGYPLYLGLILGTCKLLAVVILLLPGLLLLKEWAYAGLTILFIGAFLSHVIVGDGVGQSIWSLIFGILVLGSCALRPANRCIGSKSPGEIY